MDEQKHPIDLKPQRRFGLTIIQLMSLFIAISVVSCLLYEYVYK